MRGFVLYPSVMSRAQTHRQEGSTGRARGRGRGRTACVPVVPEEYYTESDQTEEDDESGFTDSTNEDNALAHIPFHLDATSASENDTEFTTAPISVTGGTRLSEVFNMKRRRKSRPVVRRKSDVSETTGSESEEVNQVHEIMKNHRRDPETALEMLAEKESKKTARVKKPMTKLQKLRQAMAQERKRNVRGRR